jgi:outer membrane protein assembly factor BamB
MPHYYRTLLLVLSAIFLPGCGGSTSKSGPAVPTPSPTPTPNPSAMSVLTYHNDNGRTAQNLSETALTPANVASSTFGKIRFDSADGKVDAEPLYASSVAIPGKGTHNVLVVASEHDTVYAFDADTGATLWSATMLKAGETTSDSRSCNQVEPEIGITATPVIDPKAGPNGAIYVVAMSKSGATYHQRLHALDLATGAELFNGPVDIQAKYPGTGDNSDGTNVIFDPAQYEERVALLLQNGTIYTSWASHCDIRPYTGWIIGYSASTLVQSSVLNVTPNGNEGAIWMSGGALAADDSGNIYLLDGNGTFDATLDANAFPSKGDYGNAFLKISIAGNQLAVADYFEMFNQATENGADGDLGSGSPMVLPDLKDSSGNTKHLAVGAGKDANLYVVDRDSMGKFDPSRNNIYQEISGAFSDAVFSAPAFFNGSVYLGSVGGPLEAFTTSGGHLAPAAKTSNSFAYPGANPSISANGTSNAIVWAVENTNPAILHAYDAVTLKELYNSNQASGGRDQFGAGNKFITPMIANGRVFVGTTNGVAVFGLLH